jgi:dihydrodipicolinate synthase/N-acetylneuraminate lyase
MQGIPAGNVRPPMLPLDAELENELRQIVDNTRSRVNAILDEMPGH